VIGKSECQPIGDCGSGTWGKIATTSLTVYVDGSYAGGGSDGSMGKPYVTIGAALATAKSGAQIAIAAGTYAEDVVIDKAVVLEGRCAQLVTIPGQDKSRVAAIEIAASDVTLRGLRISGPSRGVEVEGKRVVVERVAIEDCGERGIDVAADGELTVRDSLVARCHRQGIDGTDSTVLIERCVVKDTEGQLADGVWGHGIAVLGVAGTASLTVRDSLVSGSRYVGIGVFGAVTATIERTLVRDGRPQASDQAGGDGITANGRPYWAGAPTVTIRDCVVADNREAGIVVLDGHMALQRTVVRDTRDVPTGDMGFGVSAQRLAVESDPRLDMSDSLVARNHRMALLVGNGATVSVERSALQDTLPGLAKVRIVESGVVAGPLDVGAAGAVQAILTMRDTLVARNAGGGVTLFAASSLLERVLVQDSWQATSGGVGIIAVARWSPTGKPEDMQSGTSTLVLRDARIARSHGAGLSLVGTSATLERLVVQDTEGETDGLFGNGLEAVRGDQRDPSTLVLRDAVIAGNRNVGVLLASVEATIERANVRDTREQAADQAAGVGLVAMADPSVGIASTLALRDSLVARSRAVGIGIVASTATAERCRITGTAVEATGKGWGDGIQISSTADLRGRLDLADSLLDASARAGAIYYGAGGSVRRSVFRRGIFAVGLEGTADPEMSDNLFEGNVENRVTWGNKLAPSPPPKMPPPLP
jgi:hypothetical protein